jgi:tRNA 2-thiouridine synthesizing protein A
VVDSRGSFCPGPLTDLFRAYKESKNGDVLEVWATDPAADPDIRAWASRSKNEVVGTFQDKGYTRIVVKVTSKKF